MGRRRSDLSKNRWVILIGVLGVLAAIGLGGYNVYNDQVLKPNEKAFDNRAIIDVYPASHSLVQYLFLDAEGLAPFNVDLANRGNSNENPTVTITIDGATVSNDISGPYTGSASESFLSPFDKNRYPYSFFIKPSDPIVIVIVEVQKSYQYTEVIYHGNRTLSYDKNVFDKNYRLRE